MRHTEFWTRMEQALGSSAYARHWSEMHVIGGLGGRTVLEALDRGESPKDVWRVVRETLKLPRERAMNQPVDQPVDHPVDQPVGARWLTR